MQWLLLSIIEKPLYLQYKDHLGNIRLSYTDTNKDGVIQPRRYNASMCSGKFCIDDWKPGEIVEVNNYYPFGMMHNYTATTQNAYQYKYNGKELQESGMYDYGARMYMPDLGRWGVIDPLAETSRRWSTYTYAYDNPVMFIDPDGRENVSALHWKFDRNSTILGNSWFDDSYVSSGFGNNFKTMWNGGDHGGSGSRPFVQTQAFADLMDAFYNGGSGGLVNQNGTLKWWTDYEDSDPNVTGVGQFNMLKLRRENFPSNKEITPWQLGVEWLSGTGPRHRDFTNGDLMTEMLRQHSHVQATRDIILSKMALSQSSLEVSNSYKLGGIKGVGLYLKDYSTLLTGGLTGNLAVTYLGSYNLEYTAAAYNKSVVVSFHVENSSTMQSASRPPVLGYLPIWQQTAGKLINEKFKTGWGSKTTQSFHWTEVLYLK